MAAEGTEATAKDVTGRNGDSANGDHPLVVFMPSGRRGRFPVGTPVLQAARQLGVDIDSVCGGRAICGRCQIVVSEGEFAKLGVTSKGDHLSDFSPVEQRYSDKRGMKPGRRLSCQAALLGDLVIDVPEDSQVHKQVVRKRAEMRAIEIDPVVKLHYVEVAEPDMHDPTGDLQRLEKALKEQWGLTDLDTDLRVIQGLQAALRKGNWTVTVAVHLGKQITGVWPGFRDQVYGLAVDIGSTTIAGHLCELSSGEVVGSSGLMNPQIRFGEDLMSRVSYVMMNPGGDTEMTKVVRDAINDLAASVAKEAGCTVQDILEVTFVGNPIMHHLLLGINPIELGGAPFALATDGPTMFWASEIDLKIHPNARIYVLPCIAGHVGADTAGVILSESPHEADEMTLIVDVGTMPRSFWATSRSCWRHPRRPGPPSRARRSPAASGPHPAPSSASASTARRWSHVSRLSAAICGRIIRISPSRPRRRASPASAVPASSNASPRCSCAASSPKTAWSTDRWARNPRASSRTAAPSPICCMTARRNCASPRTTCARSSWRRPRSMPAPSC